MNRRHFSIILVIVLFALLLPSIVLSRDIPPIVSTDWLLANLRNPQLIILDVRRVEAFQNGYIPGTLYLD